MTKTPFTRKGEQTAEYLRLLCYDVCGPINIQVIGGLSYFIIFTNNHTRYGYVYLIKFKYEAFKKFKKIRSKVEKQIGKINKII